MKNDNKTMDMFSLNLALSGLGYKLVYEKYCYEFCADDIMTQGVLKSSETVFWLQFPRLTWIQWQERLLWVLRRAAVMQGWLDPITGEIRKGKQYGRT